jgi:hypothetical protein
MLLLNNLFHPPLQFFDRSQSIVSFRLHLKLQQIWNLVKCDQFSILGANTCQFHKFTFKNVKLLKFLKVLKITTCFGQYGHPQVLKSSGRNSCYSAAIACVPSMRTYVCNMRENFLLEFLYVKFLCIVWLLVDVLPVVLRCPFSWVGLIPPLYYDCVAVCCFLLVLFRISGCGCGCMYHSFAFRYFSSLYI